MTRTTALALVVLAAALLLPALADASNRRIAISDYKWSDENLHLDLGEHVTWYWTGPDTMHSVTGQPPNATQWDSDPGTLPQHNIGDDYQIDFDKPGVYSFQCKIHSLVRGTVTVSNTPGNPEAEPDPVPKSNVDLKKPVLRDARIAAEVRPPRRPAAVFDQRARQARRRVLPLQGQGEAEVRRLRDLQGPRRLQPRSSRREKAPFQAQAGPLHDRAAGYRQRPQHLQGPAAQVPDLVAAVRARRKVIYPGTLPR